MPDAGTEGFLSELIGATYDCALDPSRWELTLETIAHAFDCSVASLTLSDVAQNRFLINKAAGWDAQLLKLKSERHVPEINARLTEWLSTRDTIDDPFVTSRHLTAEYIGRSRYVDECLRPQGIVDIMHLFLTYTPMQFSELGLGRHARQGAITEREIALAKLILPHIRRAVTISDLLDTRAIERARMGEVLDALSAAVVLADGAGKILYANRSADRMLHQGCPIGERRGLLHAQDPSATRELRRAITLAARDEADVAKAKLAIRLTEPELPAAFAYVLPMSAGDYRTRFKPSAVAAVFVGGSSERDGARIVASAFGLTATEERVLEGLLAGHSLAEVAQHLRIAPSTAKTHLKHMFEKAGVSRQTELIRVAMQLSVAATPA